MQIFGVFIGIEVFPIYTVIFFVLCIIEYEILSCDCGIREQ